MTELDEVIASAYQSEGKREHVNKVYLVLLRTPLLIPTKKNKDSIDPLFAKIDGNYFVLAFDCIERFNDWAGDQADQIDYATIRGIDVIADLNDNVYLCLNLGSQFYKEFSPAEIKQLKMVASKIIAMKQI